MVRLPIAGSQEKYQVNPSKIICLGLNYHSHIQESESVKVQGFTPDIPEEPILFPKSPNVLIGHEDAIIIPRFLEGYKFPDSRVDYEAELAFFIKDQCKNIQPEKAYEHILGFTCMNDVSQRNIQNGDRSGWFRGKSFDTFGPVGPVLVLTQDLPDAQNLAVKCRLNGKIVQESNTENMIFTIPQLLAFISLNFTLMPGDLISTGTPAGVGPMKPGDMVEVEVQGIGVLKNLVQAEA